MQLQPECIPCILTMTIKALRRLNLDEKTVRELTTQVLSIPQLRAEQYNRTSPEIIEEIMELICRATNDTDPFAKEKQDLNKRVTAMVPFAEYLIESAPDPLYTSAKLAILGNAIDFMMPGGIHALESYIKEKMELELSSAEYDTFIKKLSRTQRILYFTDNCGEIVLDKLFIRTLKKLYDIKITIVTRHLPTLNDAVLKDALDIGLDEAADVIDNGIDGPLPGTIIERCSAQVKDRIAQAGLIISKGGGNFDTLSEQVDGLDKDVTFMLLSKCRPINTYFNTEMHQPILANIFKTWN